MGNLEADLSNLKYDGEPKHHVETLIFKIY